MADRDPWIEGHEAYGMMKSLFDNPYHPDYDEEAHESWKDGWRQAKKNDSESE